MTSSDEREFEQKETKVTKKNYRGEKGQLKISPSLPLPFFVPFVSFCSILLSTLRVLAFAIFRWQSFPNLPKVPASRSPIMSVTILTVVAP
jgi:hypothetical protein